MRCGRSVCSPPRFRTHVSKDGNWQVSTISPQPPRTSLRWEMRCLWTTRNTRSTSTRSTPSSSCRRTRWRTKICRRIRFLARARWRKPLKNWRPGISRFVSARALTEMTLDLRLSKFEEIMEISAQLVKQLRDRTGAGMMECKKALVEAKGELAEAEVVLRKQGIASAGKKSSRTTKQGVIGTYIPPGAQLGVLIEVNCESDFVARTDDFQQLVKDLAMQVAAADPQFVRREDVTEAALAKEREIQRARAINEGKPEKMADKIVEGRMNKYFEEVCLYEQPFIKENTTTIAEVIKTKIAKLGENISVSRFVRFKVGDSAVETPAAAE